MHNPAEVATPPRAAVLLPGPDPLLVEAQGIGRTYGAGATVVAALVAATCHVAAGDHIVVMGPSGSGKSTLLHLLAGLDQPTTGTLCWPALGPRATLRPAQIALVFQRPSLVAPLSVLENVELPLLLCSSEPRSARQAARDALERLGVAALAEQLPEELSGGQAQRVALARALVSRPALILADEPTGQLDRATAVHVLDVLLAAVAACGTALVVATHDQRVADRMAQRWQLVHGVLQEVA